MAFEIKVTGESEQQMLQLFAQHLTPTNNTPNPQVLAQLAEMQRALQVQSFQLREYQNQLALPPAVEPLMLPPASAPHAYELATPTHQSQCTTQPVELKSASQQPNVLKQAFAAIAHNPEESVTRFARWVTPRRVGGLAIIASALAIAGIVFSPFRESAVSTIESIGTQTENVVNTTQPEAPSSTPNAPPKAPGSSDDKAGTRPARPLMFQN